MQGADQPLPPAVVAERAAGGVDAGGEGGVRDAAAAPDRLEQLVLAHHALAMADQVDQEVEHLRLDLDCRTGRPQLAAVRIEGEAVELPDHDRERTGKVGPP